VAEIQSHRLEFGRLVNKFALLFLDPIEFLMNFSYVFHDSGQVIVPAPHYL
jgi:hypothetical protein